MDRASDELIQQILGAASKLAPQRVERLVQEATCEAEQEVRALVKSAMKAAMLRQVAEQLQNGPAAPTTPVVASDEPSETATGCYVYCITHANAQRAPNSSLRQIRDDGLAATVADVELEAFRRTIDPERDLPWLEEKVAAHNDVIRQAAELGAVIPLQFCTILRDDQAVVDLLRKHRDALEATLEKLEGKREWGVKFLAPSDARHAGPEKELAENSGPASGTAYLLKKQSGQAKRRQARNDWSDFLRSAQARLAERSADSRILPVARKAGNIDDVLSNGAYLVSDAALESFDAMLAQLADEAQQRGLKLQKTGPWPAYNFVDLQFSTESAR